MEKIQYLKDLLALTIQHKASDLHLTEKTPPIFRIDGRLVPLNTDPLSREQIQEMIYSVLSDSQKTKFEQEKELDFSLALTGLDRFRVNVHIQRGSVEAALRRISLFIPSMEELQLPPIIIDLARKQNGLVLVTGPTGTGKTTTLASIINLINSERTCVITCIEDPIEYIFTNKKSVIKQREVYRDTNSFAEALKRCLRQDPDVIVVGEMRDLETISTALTAAETGHLVLATVHTPDAPQTIERIIDVFPPYQQQQVRLQLSSVLQGVVSQKLAPRASGQGRIMVPEIMIATPGVRNMIREKSVEQLRTAIQTGGQYGMRTFDKSLQELYEKDIITYQTALSFSTDINELRSLLKKDDPAILCARRLLSTAQVESIVMSYTVTLLPGDGIGPEVVAAMKMCVDATGVKINWEEHEVGEKSMQKYGTPLTDAVLESIRRNKTAIKGPITTPIGRGFRSVNVQLRQSLDLFACVRPCLYYEGTKTPIKNVNLMIFRENTEDLYAGIEFDLNTPECNRLRTLINEMSAKKVKEDAAISIKPISMSASKRIVKFAFDWAVKLGRKKITAVHKANIMKFTDGLFLKCAQEVAREYEGKIEFSDCIVDNMCMQLVQQTSSYDCLVLPNLYGDIVSDLCAGLVGGLGVAPGANYGDEIALFEPVHGSAPKYTGQNKVNPTATILSAVWMLRHLKEASAADRLDHAVRTILKEGKSVTYDLKPDRGDSSALGTIQMAEAICKKL